MKAIITTRYGPPEVLQLAEVEKPIPKSNEVRIKIYATTVNLGDCDLRAFNVPASYWLPLRIIMGITKPKIKIFGQELAGEIESVGNEVTYYKPGEKVFLGTNMKLGGYAEFVCIPADYPMGNIPDGLSYQEAATIPVGGCNALYFIRKATITQGEKVLINGAGGSIGTYALQLIKKQGAEVTVVDSAEKLDMLRSIGADYTIDYKAEDFTRNGKKYDVILDVIGKAPYTRTLKCLTYGGRYVLINLSLELGLRILWTKIFSKQKVSTEIGRAHV